jgi:Ser/Thr protein kinase RdoA (MazF antagonist)
MNPLTQGFAYHAIIALGVAGLIALLLLAGAGIVHLYVWFLERYLTAKKLRELFREFMFQRMVHDGKPKRKEWTND